MIRRLVVLLGLTLLLATAMHATAARAADKELHIGLQKYGTLIILRNRHTLETALQPLGWHVTWTEFPGGPQLLEGLNVGAVDFGIAGEAPPVFAQAADAPLLYVGYEPPAPRGEAILVKADSPIHSIADLKGRRVALNKGSNVQYLLVQALKSAHLAFTDIQPVYLAPADGRAAFTQGAVDAWAIWDPYLASAQADLHPRVLVDGAGEGGHQLAPNTQFFLATRSLASQHADVLHILLRQLDETDHWAQSHQGEAAAILAPGMGLPTAVITASLARMGYGVLPMTPAITADQQNIADAFAALHLIPAPIKVSDVIWTAAQ